MSLRVETMSTLEEIETAARRLPVAEQRELVKRLSDALWAVWDEEVEADTAAGRRAPLIAEVALEVRAYNAYVEEHGSPAEMARAYYSGNDDAV